MPITARYINLAQIERLDDRSNEHYITAAVYRQSTVPLFSSPVFSAQPRYHRAVSTEPSANV